MALTAFAETVLHPPVLFFLLGMLAVYCRSDLEIPPQIAKFLSLYLLFGIGIKGGQELFYSGFTLVVVKVILVCVLFSFGVPFVIYQILIKKLKPPDAAAIAAAYGSISAVTFATAISFLETHHVSFGGYMVAGMALMESPAIISGLILYQMAKRQSSKTAVAPKVSKSLIIREAVFNGSVFLLIGSLFIGLLCGESSVNDLKPFVDDAFKGMLSIYMLDMGLIAARRFKDMKQSGVFLGTFGIVFPLVASVLGILVGQLMGLGTGDALLMTVLIASASYIAVPAAMRHSIPEANMSLLLPTALGVTFTFNIIVGIPLYFRLITYLDSAF
ncbi:MAG: sodium-dependent bicarbonate transport family permease [Vampirovibrionales bacterium]|nr:sodium-dependent bicarbonate transport family permease [Vampirovibrionales bacterium]